MAYKGALGSSFPTPQLAIPYKDKAAFQAPRTDFFGGGTEALWFGRTQVIVSDNFPFWIN
jgi:hypothetical protein